MIVPQNPTYAYVGAFVDELARAGVRDVVICPGSRSTPLTLTFAAEERIRKWVLVDERSAAFFALGIAKRSGVPVALVCTSGTAAANFYPAICEAKASRVPLLVLTADRPPELQEVGAPQTMGQKYLYGEHVKWFTEMPLPEATDTLLRYARFTANRVVSIARSMPEGPIHINFPFREPLSNSLIPTLPLPDESKRDKEAWEGRPFRYTSDAVEIYRSADTVYSSETIKRYERGLLVVGPHLGSDLEAPHWGMVMRFAEYWKFPILADPLSQIRFIKEKGLIVDNYDAILRDAKFVKQYQPDLIIRFGAMPTSKAFLQYLQACPNCDVWLVESSNEWLDPTLSLALVFSGDTTTFISTILHEARELDIPPREKSEWYDAWQAATLKTKTVLSSEINRFDDMFEGRVFTELAEVLPDKATLLVGNSMPIRDCDTFFPATTKQISVFGNRGVNGIDGMTSTALGISAVQGEPTILVVGDLTFYHDLNGLLAAKKYGLNLTIVVINNDGGGIFSFLPQAEHHPDHFEDYFGTPTGLDFRLVTEMYGGTFTRIENWDDFRTAVTTGITEGGLHVVEVPTNRERNVEMHRHLWKKVSEGLKTVNESDDSERK